MGRARRRLSWLLALMTTALASGTAMGAAVISLLPSNHVIIDVGHEDGLVVSDKVCFLDASGREVACGEITHMRSSVSGVRLSKSDRPLVTVGMGARSTGLMAPRRLAPVAKGEIDTLAEQIEADEAALRKAAAAPSAPPPKPPAAGGAAFARNFRVETGLLTTPILPFAFTIPNYDLEAEKAGSKAVWKTDKAVSSSLVGTWLGLHAPIAGGWSAGLRLHMRHLPTDEVDVDYDEGDTGIYARGKTTATSRGVTAELTATGGAADGWAWLGHGGLMLDQSHVKIEVTQNDEETGESARVALYESDLRLLGLTGGMSLHWVTGPVALGGGLVLIAPVQGNSKVGGVEVTPKPSGVDQDTSESSLVRTVDHHRTDVGLELRLSLTGHF